MEEEGREERKRRKDGGMKEVRKHGEGRKIVN